MQADEDVAASRAIFLQQPPTELTFTARHSALAINQPCLMRCLWIYLTEPPTNFASVNAALVDYYKRS